MIKKIFNMGLIASCLLISAHAEVDLTYFKSVVPDVTVSSVRSSEIEGIYKVILEESPYPIYLSKDGKYMLEGQAIDLVNKVNLTEKHLAGINKQLLSEIKESDMIIFKAPNEKHVINVFTDIECPYCQLLHHEMAKYHKEGITVRYIAFPRMGVNSKGYRELVSVWCADDPRQALTTAKDNKEIEEKLCENNPIVAQYHLGIKMGVNGTPAIFLEDGTMLGGYVSAKELKRTIVNSQKRDK